MSTTTLYGIALACGCSVIGALSASTLPPGDDSIPEPPAQQTDETPASPTWAGTYKGVFPAADCPGIETTLTLTDQGEYKLVSTYLADKPQTFTATGKINWIELGKKFEILESDYAAQFEIDGDKILKLTPQGKRVEGPLATHYVLTRQPASES